MDMIIHRPSALFQDIDVIKNIKIFYPKCVITIQVIFQMEILEYITNFANECQR